MRQESSDEGGKERVYGMRQVREAKKEGKHHIIHLKIKHLLGTVFLQSILS